METTWWLLGYRRFGRVAAPYAEDPMGRGDNRLTPKIKRRRSEAKKKARTLKAAAASKAAAGSKAKKKPAKKPAKKAAKK
jgi:hypothetical protein